MSFSSTNTKVELDLLLSALNNSCHKLIEATVNERLIKQEAVASAASVFSATMIKNTRHDALTDHLLTFLSHPYLFPPG